MFRERATRKRRQPFVKPQGSDSYYDIVEDYELIEASFAQQYGIRLRYENQMSWDEFLTLLSGLNSDTPIGNIVAIRAETNSDKIKNFTPEQKRIRNQWRSGHRHIITDKDDIDNAMNGFSEMFKSIGKG